MSQKGIIRSMAEVDPPVRGGHQSPIRVASPITYAKTSDDDAQADEHDYSK